MRRPASEREPPPAETRSVRCRASRGFRSRRFPVSLASRIQRGSELVALVLDGAAAPVESLLGLLPELTASLVKKIAAFGGSLPQFVASLVSRFGRKQKPHGRANAES